MMLEPVVMQFLEHIGDSGAGAEEEAAQRRSRQISQDKTKSIERKQEKIAPNEHVAEHLQGTEVCLKKAAKERLSAQR